MGVGSWVQGLEVGGGWGGVQEGGELGGGVVGGSLGIYFEGGSSLEKFYLYPIFFSLHPISHTPMFSPHLSNGV